MGAKPTERRFVSKKQYRRVRRQIGSTYLTAVLAVCFGILFLGMTVFSLIFSGLGDLHFVVFFRCLGVLGLWSGKVLFKDAGQIEPVEMLTTQNAKYAPDEQILVRGSEHPVIDTQAELLRPLPSESSTPPEQLLRATLPRKKRD